jgi:hypothetical protein
VQLGQLRVGMGLFIRWRLRFVWRRAVLDRVGSDVVGCVQPLLGWSIFDGVGADVVRRMLAVLSWEVLDSVWGCGFRHVQCVRSRIVRVGAGHAVIWQLLPVRLRSVLDIARGLCASHVRHVQLGQLRVGMGLFIRWRLRFVWRRAVLDRVGSDVVGCVQPLFRGIVRDGVGADVVRRMLAVLSWEVLDSVWGCGFRHVQCVRCRIVRLWLWSLGTQLVCILRLGAVLHGSRRDGLWSLLPLHGWQLLVCGGAAGYLLGALLARAVLHQGRSHGVGHVYSLRCRVLRDCLRAEQLHGMRRRDIRDRVRNDVLQQVRYVCGWVVRNRQCC